jgi:cytochrome c553
MNRAFLPVVAAAFLGTALLSGIARAETAAPAAAAAPAKPDPAKGSTLYANGDTARNIPACVTCHGAGGNSTMAANPKLANQNQHYLYKQLVDFTTPARVNPIMTPYAKALNDTEKHDLAAFLATQPEKPGAAKNKDTVELGRKIWRGGIADKGVAACASCHGATGAGIPLQYPRLSGQQQDYTLAQLVAFRDNKRSNSVPMTTLAKRLSDDEMKAVADYIAGVK